jgi:putative hydrolase of the HAD superfamily
VTAVPGRRVDGVLLDLDDTLIDTRGAVRAAIGSIVARWIPGLDERLLEQAVLRWAQDPHGYFRAYTRGEYDLFTMRRLRAEDLHARFGGPVLNEAQTVEWIAHFHRELKAAWRTTAEAAEAVDGLLALGLRIGAVTNALRDEQQAKLEALGLADRVPILACIDDLGFGKPDPRVFRLACDRLGLSPARTAYVGDELDIDARAATAAGLLGVWLDRHGSGERVEDVPVITDLLQLPAVLGTDLGPVGRTGRVLRRAALRAPARERGPRNAARE